MDKNFLKIWPENYLPKVSRHVNLTVSSLGPAFSGKVPVISTCYRYPYALAKGLILSLASIVKRRATYIKIEQTPAFIHSQWSRGYYHWMTESLPRALQVAREYPDAIVLIPEKYNSFHPESLKLLGVHFSYFPDHNIQVDRGILTSCPKHYGTTEHAILVELRDRLAKKTISNVSFGERIYISRSLARGRKVSNEEQVIDLLKTYGFQVLRPEEFSFSDQVSIFRKAKFTVGIHGAGLSNLLFMEKNSSVIELLPYRNGLFDMRPNSLSFKHDNCYFALANQCGHTYRYLQCKHDKAFYQRTSLANISVDCKSLQGLVEELIF